MGGRGGGPRLSDLSRPIASYQKQREGAVGGLLGYDFGPLLNRFTQPRKCSSAIMGQRHGWLVQHDYPALEAVFVDDADHY